MIVDAVEQRDPEPGEVEGAPAEALLRGARARRGRALELRDRYDWVEPEEADIIVALGGLGWWVARQRAKGKCQVVLEWEHRGAKIIARVAFWTSWRGEGEGVVQRLPLPPSRAAVFTGRDDAHLRHLLDGSAWGVLPRRSLAARAGDQEGTGGFAAAAISALASGEIDGALLLGVTRDELEGLIDRNIRDALAAADFKVGEVNESEKLDKADAPFLPAVVVLRTGVVRAHETRPISLSTAVTRVSSSVR